MDSRFEKDQVIFRVGEMANRFYLIESGKVALESGEDIDGDHRYHRAGRFVRMVLDFSSIHLAFHRPGCRANKVDLFLRHNSARVLRYGPSAGLRVVQADERSDDAPSAERAGPDDRRTEKNGAGK